MSETGFISREQLAQKCKISSKTLYRKMKKTEIKIPPGYISPTDQERILNAIGHFMTQKNKQF